MVLFQYRAPLDQAVSAVSKPALGSRLLFQFPSLLPQEAYPIRLSNPVRNTVSSSSITGRFIEPLSVVLASYKASFQNLYPELLRLVATSSTKSPRCPRL